MLSAITWYKQSAYLWRGPKIVYIDPWEVPSTDPPADLILITHAHFDHFSTEDIERLTKPGTIIFAPGDVAEALTVGDVRPVAPGERLTVSDLVIETYPAYNLHPDRLQAHPRENNWVGYIIQTGSTRAYFAGDTDHIPEMSAIKTEIAFVPIGGTYTMDVPEAAAAVKDIAPKIAVPQHYGYVVGTARDGERFVKEIAPIEGRLLEPVHPFAS